MASFPLKNAHFPTPVYSAPNLRMFPLHCIPEILYTESIDTTNYLCKKFFSMTQRLATIHPLRTDRRTYVRETDGNGTIDAYSIAVIKNAHQKLCTV